MSNNQKYVQFNKEELDEFCKSLDYEGNGYICLFDIEEVCKNLGLEEVYSSINSILHPYCNTEKLGISIEDIKKVLNNDNISPKQEIKELFNSMDYDNKKFINKNKLRINMQQLLNIIPTDEELDDMINYISKEDKIVMEDLYKLIE